MFARFGLGTGFGRLGNLWKSAAPVVAGNAITTDAADPITTDAGDPVVTG